MEPWIETRGGRSFWYDRENPENIDIFDIASALSKVCRFSGHCRKFYSVAEHSYLVSFLVPHHLALEALLHDASEAYLADIPSPVKQLLPDYKRIEVFVMQQVADKFNLKQGFESLPEIKQADWAQLKAEAVDLLSSQGSSWYFPEGLPDGKRPSCFTPQISEIVFLERFNSLYNERKLA